MWQRDGLGVWTQSLELAEAAILYGMDKEGPTV